MHPARTLVVLVALAAPVAGRAERLPSFDGRTCCYEATHIVLVKTEIGEEGKFRVVESWKGDLKKDETLRVPGLAKEAKGEMVLFVRRVPKQGVDEWRPASIHKDWRTSVAWLDGDAVSAVHDDPWLAKEPTVVRLPYVRTRQAFRDLVAYFDNTEKAFAKAKGIEDPAQRGAAFVEIINGEYDRKEDAIAELGLCGPKAVPAIQKLLESPPSHDHKYYIAALVAAGGRDIVPDIAQRIAAELRWWAEEGPNLQKSWWLLVNTEAWKRHGTLIALLDVYRTHPSATLEKQLLAVRGLMRNLPLVDSDRGITSLSAYCDRLLREEFD